MGRAYQELLGLAHEETRGGERLGRREGLLRLGGRGPAERRRGARRLGGSPSCCVVRPQVREESVPELSAGIVVAELGVEEGAGVGPCEGEGRNCWLVIRT